MTPPVRFQWNRVLAVQLMRDKANEELEKASAFILYRMKTDVPKDTGALLRSLRYVHDWNMGRSTFYIPLDYGIYQEFGTRFMKPQPYVRPSLLAAALYWRFNVVAIELHPGPQISAPLRATTSGFGRPYGVGPDGKRRSLLTRQQERHVRANLVKTSKKYATAFKSLGVRYRVKGPK